MNIEGITLLNQFVEYSCKPFIVIILLTIGAIIGLVGALLCEKDSYIGPIVIIVGIISAIVFGLMAAEEEHKTLLNYPEFTHYIIQIDDKAAWTEIAPNYTIVEEVYPDTGIYEIKREYKEGDE